MKVLMVERDAAVAEATGMLLQTDGHDVLHASNVHEATTLVAAHGAPDALVCAADIHHRGGSIADAIHALREHVGRVVPAIIITSDVPSVTAPAVRTVEACHVLPKPNFAVELLNALRQLMPGERASRFLVFIGDVAREAKSPRAPS